MRIFSSLVAAGCLLTIAGCHGSKWSFVRNNDSPRVSGEAPTAAQLVAYLNDNSQRLRSLQSVDVDLDAKQGNQPIGLRAKLACQQPRNFRLFADALGNSQADLGSNEQEFWFWIAKADPPYLYHCSYQDFARGVQVPFPFQPEWVMEALGMADFGAPENYTVVPRGNTVELVRQTTSPQGQPVRKVIVFNRGRSGAQILGHMLLDARGQQICSAQIEQTQVVDGVVVPYKLVLRWPSEKMQLTIRMNQVSVNRIDAEMASRLFARPPLQNVPTYDLARGLESQPGQPLRRTGGLFRGQ
jgi:hypothetical protein